MPANEDRFPATDRKVLRRLDEQATRQVSLGIVATVGSFLAIVWIGDLWRHWPRVTVVFGALILAVSLLQGVLILGFDALYPRGPGRWRRRFAFTLFLRAAIWSGFLVALLESYGGGELFFLSLFLPLVLSAALAATWLADIWTVRLYAAISVAPVVVRLLLEATPQTALMAAMLGVFIYAIVRMSDGHYRLFWRVLSRSGAPATAAPLAGSVHARLLLRTADELRRPVATVTDAMTLVASGRGTPELLSVARASALHLVDRLEAMETAASFLRSDRVPEVTAGSLRRRCEDATDDIGIVAADAGILCTTVYDPALPERLRTDYGLLFRGLRAMASWTLEQLPAGGELIIRFSLVPGQQDDYLRCAVDVDHLHLSESLRNGIDRCAHGDGILDPEVPLPLAIAGEVGRLLGGRIGFVTVDGGTDNAQALALDIHLDLTERADTDNPLRGRLKARRVLVAGGSPTLAAALKDECALVDIKVEACLLDAVAARLQAGDEEWLALLLDAREPARVAAQLAAIREAKSLRGARVLLMAAGAEAPALPDDVQRMVHGWLRLPVGRRRLRQLLAKAAGIEDVLVGGAAAPETAARPLRILLVDDNPVNLMVARGMLEKLGCEVETVDGGQAAVSRVGRGGIDLVLMDCEMPGMDGSEATRRIREEEATRNQRRLSIVAMTAHTGESEVAGFLASGMDDFIPKPVSLANLAARIERFRLRR